MTNPSARSVPARKRRAPACPPAIGRLRAGCVASTAAAEGERPAAADAHSEEGRLGPLALTWRGRTT